MYYRLFPVRNTGLLWCLAAIFKSYPLLFPVSRLSSSACRIWILSIRAHLAFLVYICLYRKHANRLRTLAWYFSTSAFAFICTVSSRSFSICCSQNHGRGPRFKTSLWSVYLSLVRAVRRLIYTLGLELAKLADLPESVLAEGKRVAESLAALHARDEAQSQTSKIATRRKALLRVCSRSSQLRALTISAFID